MGTKFKTVFAGLWLVACSGLDGGLESVEKLPTPIPSDAAGDSSAPGETADAATEAMGDGAVEIADDTGDDATTAPDTTPEETTDEETVVEPPAVTIIAPTEGEVVEGTRLRIAISTENFVLDGAATPGHGTWRVRLDGLELGSGLVVSEANVSGLAAGPHTVEVELTSAAGDPLTPPVSDRVTFETSLRPPAIDIVLPTATRVGEGLVRVAVLPHFFTFTSGTIPGPLVPATGGWQLMVDDVVVADRLTSAQTEIELAPGTHRLVARLVDNTGIPLDPPAESTRTLEVEAVETSVAIISPPSGATVPRRFPVAVAFEDFILSPDTLAPDAEAVPGRGHFHAFLRREGTADFIYQGFFLEETFELQVDSAGTFELLVALHHENHQAVMPAVEDTITVTVDDTPTIHIASPRAGDVLGRDPFPVSVQIDNFALVPLGEPSNDEGHYHLFIDSVYQNFFLDPVALIDPLQTQPSPLEEGEHRLEAFLHRSNHSPVEGSIGAVVDVFYDPRAKVTVITPRDGRRVTTDPFIVSVELENLALVDAAGDAAVPGQGHIHVFIDDEYQGFETRSAFVLSIAEPGEHTIKLALHENDHSAIPDAVPAFVDVVVDDTPRARIVTPEDMSFVYLGDVEVVLAAENLPEEAAVEVWVDDVLVAEAPVGVPIALPPLSEGEHTIATVPLDAGGDPLAGSAIDTVRFEVTGLTVPTLSFVEPLPNATLAPGAPVTIGTTGFSIGGDLARGPAVPGDGWWTLRVGPTTYGPWATQSIALPAVPVGAYELVAELWHRDGSRVVPGAIARVPVQIEDAPALSLVRPLPGQTVYGPRIPLALHVAGIELGPDSGWVSVAVDGRQAGFLSRTHGVIGAAGTGLHVLGLELRGALGQALEPPVTVTSRFRVGGPELPSIAIEGTAQSDGAVEIAFAVEGLELDPLGVAGPPQPGRGAVLVLVDARVVTIATASPARLEGLSPEPHTVELVLASLDLMPLWPRISDEVELGAFGEASETR